MRPLTKIDTYNAKTGNLNVIVETPQGSRNKYKYDERLKLFAIHCLLPAGCVFPFDFGFLPSTLGEDGDPLDILVLMEEPAPAGFLVPARLIGVIEAEQTEKGQTRRNDRLLTVSVESHHHREVHSPSDLCNLKEIEHFFVSYNEQHGKQFKPIGHYGADRARELVKEGQKRFSAVKKLEFKRTK